MTDFRGHNGGVGGVFLRLKLTTHAMQGVVMGDTFGMDEPTARGEADAEDRSRGPSPSSRTAIGPEVTRRTILAPCERAKRIFESRVDRGEGVRVLLPLDGRRGTDFGQVSTHLGHGGHGPVRIDLDH